MKSTAKNYNRKTLRYTHEYQCIECKNNVKFIAPNKVMDIGGRCRSCCNRKKGRPGKLKNVFNGEVVDFITVTEFCRERPELGENAANHLWSVLEGKRLHYKDWCLPELDTDQYDVKKVYQIVMMKK
jgi:hypothetical protein